MAPTFFASAAHFGRWLQTNHAKATELLVGFHKVDSGVPSMSWPESVDEALCFGWIDGVRKRIDDASYQIRFTPRRPGSIWSHVNVAKVAQLTEQGRMQPAGLAAFAARSDRKTGVYAFEREAPAALDAAELRVFKKNKAAWAFFDATPPGYQRVLTHWIVSAKQAATRERRLAQLIEASAEQRRLR